VSTVLERYDDVMVDGGQPENMIILSPHDPAAPGQRVGDGGLLDAGKRNDQGQDITKFGIRWVLTWIGPLHTSSPRMMPDCV